MGKTRAGKPLGDGTTALSEWAYIPAGSLGVGHTRNQFGANSNTFLAKPNETRLF
jgi:hypothetical protein